MVWLCVEGAAMLYCYLARDEAPAGCVRVCVRDARCSACKCDGS